MCWDSVDPRLNVFDIETYSKAARIVRFLEDKYPNFTFQIFEVEEEYD